MERRLGITYIVAATTTFGVACVTIATASGGLFASAAAPSPAGTKRVEIVDEYIVIRSSTTSTTVTPADLAIVPIDTTPAAAPRSQIARPSAPAPAPAAGPSAPPEAAAQVEPAPEQQESPAPVPTEPLPTATPAVPTAPAPSQSPPTPPAPPAAEPPATHAHTHYSANNSSCTTAAHPRGVPRTQVQERRLEMR